MKKINPDISKMKQMRKMAAVREDFIEEHIDEKFIALHLETYHDIIQELLYAQLYKRGLFCKSEEAVLAFAIQYFPLCKQHKNMLAELYTCRKKIHSLKPQQIKKFLQIHNDALHAIIQELKH